MPFLSDIVLNLAHLSYICLSPAYDKQLQHFATKMYAFWKKNAPTQTIVAENPTSNFSQTMLLP